MSDLEEPRLRCPSCGKNVPAMKYCIYCGAKLPPVAPSPVRPPTPSLPPALPPTAPPPLPPPSPVPLPSVPMGIESEITNLMSSITTLYERKVSLLDLFRSGEISGEVFLKLYNEYSGKLGDLLNARIRKMEELRNRLDERNKRLSEVHTNLEELQVRYKIGELDLNVFSQRAEKLKMEEKELRDAATTLRMNLDRLEKILSDKKAREIRDLETKMKSCYEALEKVVGEGKISVETLNKIRSDTDETIAFFDSLIRDRKEKEKELREQLETLQARYKISEVSVEDYEKRKRELQEEIDKVWA